jgi:hypothetical protein
MYEMDQYTVSLLHFDSGLTDESGKVWTANGGAATSTAQSKFGSSSLYLNGSGQYLITANSSEFDFQSADFTIDWWEYRTSNANLKTCFARDTSIYYPYGCGISRDGVISFDVSAGGSVKLGNIVLNAWTHYAVCRKNNTYYGFQNGELITTKYNTTSIPVSSLSPSIGRFNDKSYFEGYIDEFRISNIARWTSSFIPPTSNNPPTNLTATADDSQVTLSWNAVEGAASYNVKRSTTAGGPYATIATNIPDTSYLDTTVANGTTYYYVVTAVDSSGNESANSNEASATPVAAQVPGQALLRITMNDSSEREYRLSIAEIENFIKWYDRTVGTGNTCYAFDDIVDLSKEYLSFEKIISFKVVPLKD